MVEDKATDGPIEVDPFEMDDVDIWSTVLLPDYCPRCGTELTTCRWEGREHPWCPEDRLVFGRVPVPGAHVVVHDDEEVLLLDEPIPQHEGVWSLPGGHARPDEHPRVAGLRELEEETGLRADADDLRFVNVLHVDLEDIAYYLITYAIDRSAVAGELSPEFEGFEAFFHPIEELRNDPERIRDNDLERIELAFEG